VVSYFDQTAHRDVARLWTCPTGTELKSATFSTLHRGTPARSGAGVTGSRMRHCA